MLQNVSLRRVGPKREAMRRNEIAFANSLTVLRVVLCAFCAIVAVVSTHAAACGTPH
jgi:hypothetical protein